MARARRDAGVAQFVRAGGDVVLVRVGRLASELVVRDNGLEHRFEPLPALPGAAGTGFPVPAPLAESAAAELTVVVDGSPVAVERPPTDAEALAAARQTIARLEQLVGDVRAEAERERAATETRHHDEIAAEAERASAELDRLRAAAAQSEGELAAERVARTQAQREAQAELDAARRKAAELADRLSAVEADAAAAQEIFARTVAELEAERAARMDAEREAQAQLDAARRHAAELADRLAAVENDATAARDAAAR